MNKKAYNKARKNHYNVKVVKGNTDAYFKAEAKKAEAIEKAQAEAKENGTLKPSGIVVIANEKPEVIKDKKALMEAEKARLEHELQYEYKTLNAKRDKPYYMCGVSEDVSRRYDSIAVKAEAIQKINEDAEASEKAKEAKAMYNTCGAWLAETDTDKQYKPIDCLLWAFARKQKTREASAILDYTESGFRKDTNAYNDYRQECYVTLFEYAINNPTSDFGKALFLCMKKGIQAEFSKTHKYTRDSEGNTIVRFIDSLDKALDSEDSNGATLKDALPDTLSRPLDYDLIQAEKCEDVILTYTRNDIEENIIKEKAEGYTLKEIAFYSGETYDATAKRYERLKERAEAKAERIKEKKKAEYLERVAKAEAKHKANEPKTEVFHKTEVKPEVKPYDVPNTRKAFERMITRPAYHMVLAEGKKKSEVTYKTATRVKSAKGTNTKRIKSGTKTEKAKEVIVTYVEHKKPEAKPKYTSYSEDDKLVKRIAEADARKAEFKTWEKENEKWCAKVYG